VTASDAEFAPYPRPFPVKLFLRPDPAHEAALEALAAELTADQEQPATVERRPSRGGRYLCVTVTFEARDAEHARRIGLALAAANGVIMSL
jgi:Protein of unknown function (DUF493).